MYVRLDVSTLMDFTFQGNDTWGSFKTPSLMLHTHDPLIPSSTAENIAAS